MKTLIFSDTHLSDKFDQQLYSYIVPLIESVEQVIINGDFWDGYLTTFDRFINSEWQKIFPLLKSKKAVYIYGNHDYPELIDDRSSQFSLYKANQWLMETKFGQVHVEHGHQIAPEIDGYLPNLSRISAPIYQVYHYLEAHPGWPSKVIGKPIYLKNLLLSNKLRKYAKTNLDNNKILVCGHSHIPVHDLENNYLNPGQFRFGWARYLLVDDLGIRRISERYARR